MRPTPLTLHLAAACIALAAFTPRAACVAQTVPTAEAVLARHEAACGGADALNKHSTIKLTGTVEITNSDLRGTIEILRGKPNRYVQTMVLNRVGTMIRGFDSTVAWVVDLSGPALLTGPDAQAVEVEANWYHAFLAPPAQRIARVDSAEFAGEPAWKLTYARDLGMEVSAYFSRESGLRLGESRATPAGGNDDDGIRLQGFRRCEVSDNCDQPYRDTVVAHRDRCRGV